MIMESAWLTPSLPALNSFQNSTTATEATDEVILELKRPCLSKQRKYKIIVKLFYPVCLHTSSCT